MKVASIIKDDIVDSCDGVAVSLWCAGCVLKCKNCHNSELWDPNKFEDANIDLLKKELLEAIPNHVLHNFSILGGEPFAEWNRDGLVEIVKAVREAFPTITIRCWSGYTLEQLRSFNSDSINTILSNIDYLIDGPFVESLRNTNLTLRGSSNQKIYKNKEGILVDVTKEIEKGI